MHSCKLGGDPCEIHAHKLGGNHMRCMCTNLGEPSVHAHSFRGTHARHARTRPRGDLSFTNILQNMAYLTMAYCGKTYISGLNIFTDMMPLGNTFQIVAYLTDVACSSGLITIYIHMCVYGLSTVKK